MVNILKELKVGSTCEHPRPETYNEIYQIGEEITNRWIRLMQIEKYYFWDTPVHQAAALKNQDQFEKEARMAIFGEE